MKRKFNVDLESRTKPQSYGHHTSIKGVVWPYQQSNEQVSFSVDYYRKPTEDLEIVQVQFNGLPAAKQENILNEGTMFDETIVLKKTYEYNHRQYLQSNKTEETNQPYNSQRFYEIYNAIKDHLPQNVNQVILKVNDIKNNRI